MPSRCRVEDRPGAEPAPGRGGRSRERAEGARGSRPMTTAAATSRLLDDRGRLRLAQSAALQQLNREQGRPPSLNDLRRIGDAQQQFKQVFADLGLPQPEPTGEEWPLSYRVKCLKKLQRFS